MTRTSATAASPFAFQKKLLDPRDIEPYLDGEFITLETRDNYHLLELKFNDDAGDSDLEYVNSDQMLNSLTTLREQIIQGDYRALYVVWLLSITQMEDDPETDEILEPPVPQGLNKLDIGLRTLLEFFGIDSHLVSAATGSTHSAESTPPPDPASAIPSRTREEMESHLTAIVNGEAGVLPCSKNNSHNWRERAPRPQPRPFAPQANCSKREKLSETRNKPGQEKKRSASASKNSKTYPPVRNRHGNKSHRSARKNAPKPTTKPHNSYATCTN